MADGSNIQYSQLRALQKVTRVSDSQFTTMEHHLHTRVALSVARYCEGKSVEVVPFAIPWLGSGAST